MVFVHHLPGGRGLSPEQEAAITKAIAGGRVTEAEVGLLYAARLYADAQGAARADEALTKVKR